MCCAALSRCRIDDAKATSTWLRKQRRRRAHRAISASCRLALNMAFQSSSLRFLRLSRQVQIDETATHVCPLCLMSTERSRARLTNCDNAFERRTRPSSGMRACRKKYWCAWRAQLTLIHICCRVPSQRQLFEQVLQTFRRANESTLGLCVLSRRVLLRRLVR